MKDIEADTNQHAAFILPTSAVLIEYTVRQLRLIKFFFHLQSARNFLFLKKEEKMVAWGVV